MRSAVEITRDTSTVVRRAENKKMSGLKRARNVESRGRIVNMFRLCLVISLLAVSCTVGESDPIQRAKKATVPVIDPESGDILGTAFCVDTKGYFLTTGRIAAAGGDGALVLLLHSGTSKERRYRARLVRTDAEANLALLFCEKTGIEALPIGDDAHLQESMLVTAYGYPFGQSGEPTRAGTMRAGRITALPRTFETQQIVIDALLNQGNVGGPLLDADGRVVGVVSSAIGEADVQTATPVHRVRAFLSEPLLRAEFPETLPWKRRDEPMKLKVAVDMLAGGAPPDEAILSLNDGYGERLVHAQKSDNGFVFTTPLRTDPFASRVRVRLKLSGAWLTCPAQDTALHGAGGTFLLSQLDAYQRGKGLVTRDGRTVPLTAAKQTLSVLLAEEPVDIPMQEVAAFDVVPQVEAPCVRYRVSTHTQGVATAHLEGEICFMDVPGRLAEHERATSTPLAIPPHKPFSGLIERSLPAAITGITLAGSGRYLLLRMDKRQQLAVYDVGKLEIVKILPLPEPKTLVAGGVSSFFLVLPEKKRMECWSLGSFERTWRKSLPLSGPVTMIGMGCGSEGPLMVRTKPNGFRIDFVDLETLDPIPHLSDVQTRIGDARNMRHRFSADGRTLGLWSDGQPGGLEVLTLSGTKPVDTYEHVDAGYAAPGPDGAHIYTMLGTYGPHTGKMGASPEKFMMIPTTQPAYCLGAVRAKKYASEWAPVQLSLFVRNSSRPLVDLPKTPEVKISHRGYLTGDLMLDQLVHFVPQAKVMITIPAERNRVVARYVAIDTLLKEGDRDYFFVDSSPVRHAVQGARYRYRIHVKSKKQPVAYRLAKGPEGMQIDAQGQLSWDVQTDVGTLPVVVGLRNGAGLERFHAFTIEVVP